MPFHHGRGTRVEYTATNIILHSTAPVNHGPGRPKITIADFKVDAMHPDEGIKSPTPKGPIGQPRIFITTVKRICAHPNATYFDPICVGADLEDVFVVAQNVNGKVFHSIAYVLGRVVLGGGDVTRRSSGRVSAGKINCRKIHASSLQHHIVGQQQRAREVPPPNTEVHLTQRHALHQSPEVVSNRAPIVFTLEHERVHNLCTLQA